MTTALTETDDWQAEADREDARRFRRQLLEVAADVRRRKEDELQKKSAWKAAGKQRNESDGALAGAIEEDAPDDGAYMARLGELSRQAEAAKEAETATRQSWALAVTARRRAQDELRVAVSRRFAAAPLFDGLPSNTNGHASGGLTPPDAEPAGQDGRAVNQDVGDVILRPDLDKLLRAALHTFNGAAARWAKLAEDGASDAELKAAVAEEFGIEGGRDAGPGVRCAYKGGKTPAFWLGERARKSTLTGKRLLDKVRALLAIPLPIPGKAGEASGPTEAGGHANGRLFPDPPPEPAPPPPADADAPWREYPVEDLEAPPHVTNTLKL